MSHVAAFGTSSSLHHQHHTFRTSLHSLRLQSDIALPVIEDFDSINRYAVVSSTVLQPSPLIAAKVPHLQRPTRTNKIINTNAQTWKRRLDTHEDPLNVHKWAGLGWMLSSAAIVGCGALSGFTEVPAILEPITLIFLVSTLIQSLSSIPMATKYRANEPSVRRGFISSAITSTSTAFAGFWLGPFGDHINSVAHLPIIPDFGAAVVALLVLGDALYSLYDFTDNELDPINNSKPRKGKAALNITLDFTGLPMKVVMSGIPLNMVMLQELWVHASNARTEFLDIIATRGSSSDIVFYAMSITSIAVCTGNLCATLHHRKLISEDVNNFAIGTSIIATFAFNIGAAGIDVFQPLSWY